jgi:phosphoadenosine phosphosulfate reductase
MIVMTKASRRTIWRGHFYPAVQRRSWHVHAAARGNDSTTPRANGARGENYFGFDFALARHHFGGMFEESSQPSPDLSGSEGELSQHPTRGNAALAVELARDGARLAPAERMALLRERVDGRIVFAHGFGIEGQLLVHWIAETKLDIDLVTLDTGRLFPETYDLWALTEARYGRRIRAIYPERPELESLVATQGVNGFYESREARVACCTVRKTRPLDRALSGASVLMSGVRGDQTATRRAAGLAAFDASRGLIKFNPLFDWTREAVLAAVRANDVPINALHARGFASIGCSSCTRAIKPGEPERNGRWWWENDGNSECGLHLPRVAAA